MNCAQFSSGSNPSSEPTSPSNNLPNSEEPIPPAKTPSPSDSDNNLPAPEKPNPSADSPSLPGKDNSDLPPKNNFKSLSDKKVNIIPSNTPYETIHNLEFSLKFNNTGGIQYNTGISGTEPNIIRPHTQPYPVFGTGWLFDWKLNSDQPDSSGNINWTGYFATNLHVADALLNPDDQIYTPLWLEDKKSNFSGFDYTTEFSLGKYDNSNGPLSSLKQNTNMTFVNLAENKNGINNLPKTQFASTSFTNTPLEIKNVFDGDKQYSAYIDFAVIELTVKYIKNPTNAKEIASNNVWTYWIKPAIQTLKTLYPQDKLDPNLTYLKFFDSTSYVTQSNPDPENIYIGGYPYAKNSNAPFSLGTTNELKGSPIWLINSYKTATESQGQPIDVNNIWRASGKDTPNGIYNANSYKNFFLRYHGQDYKEYGIGYIVNDSDLQEGSSGSMALTKENKLLGIYHGSLTDVDTGADTSMGLLSALVVQEMPISSDKTYPALSAYDLIGWTSTNKKITNQNKSYFTSLTSATYFFSNL